MAAETFCFIVNCASNADKAEVLINKHRTFLSSEFDNCEFIFIQKWESIKEVALKAADNHKYIIACGGDGTVNKAANGILGTGATLGVLPIGSGNDFAKSIGVGRDFMKNVASLKEKKVAKIDVIKIGSEVFLNTYGIGLDGLTNYYASKIPFNRGSVRYFLGGLKALLALKPFHLTYKFQGAKQEDKVWMVVIANGKTEGGKYLISPTSINDDGIFEVILVKNVPRVKLGAGIYQIILGVSA